MLGSVATNRSGGEVVTVLQLAVAKHIFNLPSRCVTVCFGWLFFSSFELDDFA